MQAHAIAFVGIVWFDTEVMAAVIHRRRDVGRQGAELQEVILDIRLQAHMMHVATPVESAFRTDLVLRYGTGFGEEVIARLQHILDVLLGRGAHAEESLYSP